MLYKIKLLVNTTDATDLSNRSNRSKRSNRSNWSNTTRSETQFENYFNAAHYVSLSEAQSCQYAAQLSQYSMQYFPCTFPKEQCRTFPKIHTVGYLVKRKWRSQSPTRHPTKTHIKLSAGEGCQKNRSTLGQFVFDCTPINMVAEVALNLF